MSDLCPLCGADPTAVEALRARIAEVERERDAAILRHDEDLGRMQRVVYDALCAAVKDALPDEPLSRIDGAGSDGDEFDFTEAEVSIACGMLTDALDEARREIDNGRAHVIALEQQNVALLRWQSVASDAHIDHLCAIVRSLAMSDETPRVFRDLSAMGVEEEIRRAVAAERINRAKSEATVVAVRKERDDACADRDEARRERDEARAEVATLRAEVAAAKVRTDAIETERMWSVSAFHRTRQERDEARDEVTALRAQVAEAEQRAERERTDVVAWLRRGGWLPAKTWESVRNCFHQAADIIGRGEHEGTASPK